MAWRRTAAGVGDFAGTLLGFFWGFEFIGNKCKMQSLNTGNLSSLHAGKTTSQATAWFFYLLY